MKILQIFGAVVAVHLLAFIFIFASPGCQSGPHNVPTPDATLPVESAAAPAPVSYNSNAAPQPVDLGTGPAYSSAGHDTPTRPGSPLAAAVSPAHVTEDVVSVSTYTVVKGDSLWSVANKNHITVSALAKANKLTTGTALKPGKTLMIPGKPVSRTAPKETSAAAAKPGVSAPEKSVSSASGGEPFKYTVASGESLGVIAHKFKISVGELAAANNITDPSKVRAGQTLVIPGRKGVSKSTTSSTSRNTSSARSSAPVSAGTAAPAAQTPAATPAPAADSTHFEVTPPPPGQDLDAGLKETPTDVPTIKVEDPDAKK
ncbi:MAG TPA: LysM domain-containing protein [Lacunisphaera sp.]|jgi:LysM repeat protein